MAISPAKYSDNWNDGAHGKSDTLQHYCITALNRCQMILHGRECPAPPWTFPPQRLGRDMKEWLKQPNSVWAFSSTAGARRLKSWASIWPADGDSSLWIGPPGRRLFLPGKLEEDSRTLISELHAGLWRLWPSSVPGEKYCTSSRKLKGRNFSIGSLAQVMLFWSIQANP